MAERERSKDRPPAHHAPSQAGSGGGGGFLMGLFGGGHRRAAPPSTTRTHATQDGKPKAHTAELNREEFTSPKSGHHSSQLPPPPDRPHNAPSPAPFDLQEAIAAMQVEDNDKDKAGHLPEVVNQTASYLANILIADDIFSDTTSTLSQPKSLPISIEDIRTLYIRSAAFANAKSDSALRTAAIRLLAALIATYPPVYFSSQDQSVALPDIINTRSIYKLIVSPTAPTTAAARIEAVFVEVGALKALTKNGRDVDGLNGIVGWLVKSLTDLTDDFASWCSKKEDSMHEWAAEDRDKPFGSIKQANASDTAIAIIDLLNSIVTTHVALFSPSDLDRIVTPIIDLIVAGIAICTSQIPEEQTQSPTFAAASRKSSPMVSVVNSPSVGSGNALGLEPSLRQSVVSSRSRKDTVSSHGTSTPKMPTPRQLIGSSTAAQSPQTAGSPFRPGSPHFAAQFDAKWTRPIPALCAFLEALINDASTSDESFQNVLLFICLCFGQDESESVHNHIWSALYNVLNLMLSPKGGRRGEQILHNILQGKLQLSPKNEKLKVPEADRKLARGAVISTRSLFHHLAGRPSENQTASSALATIVPSLRAAQSTSRFIGEDKVVDRARWQPVDYEILALLQDHLFHLESGDGSVVGDAWTEGNAAYDLLHGMIPVAMSDRPSLQRRSSDVTEDTTNPLQAIFEAITRQLPGAVSRLHASSSTAPEFVHPKYIELLLEVAPHLDEEDAGVVIDYYRGGGLCLPFTSGWIQNIWKLLEAFYLSPNSFALVRRKLTDLLFKDVYNYAKDLPEHRIVLVDKAIVPFLEEVLVDEEDDEFVQEALDTLVNAAVAETMERDEERRRVRARKAREENEREDAQALPSWDLKEASTGGSFDAIRTLITKIAAQTPCKEDSKGKKSQGQLSTSTSVPGSSMLSMSTSSSSVGTAGVTVERRSSSKSREGAPSALRGIMEAISPPQRNKDLPSLSALTSPTAEVDHQSLTSALSASNPADSPNPHNDCRSVRAVSALIAIFVRLAFSPPHSFNSPTSASRTPASSRSITVYRDLLGLLFPMTDDQTSPQLAKSVPKAVKIPARCPKGRIVILQFLTRLRADTKHRIYLRPDIDKVVEPFALILKRTKEAEAEKKAEIDEALKRSASRHVARPEPEERGRASRMQEPPVNRSRSRSKQPATILRTGTTDTTYNPLWRIPDEVFFEVPSDRLPSEGMTTYDPNHPSLKDPSAPPVEGVWLPVSEYVRVLNGILRGHDWELVSYVLTFLPLQLSNKLFFHGERATKEVRALLDVLCSGVTGVGAWERRFNTPAFIKRADVNAAAYQSLSILISYRGVFTRAEADRLVQAFMAGLQGTRDLAKPCLQALTLAVYDLEQSVTRHLLDIVRAMTGILSTTGLAVHILEFLIALGQSKSLFKNFTDEQYRLVFRVAIGYITEHNARSDQAVDLRDISTREAYILSQHVIGLAYYAIYIWFMALRLPQRPDLVSEITREILKGRSQRVNIDEMVEVCFDWLARYTYGNADPKPASSFLSEIVMAEGNNHGEAPKTQSWLLGGAIITITSHARSGWHTITTTRPTGATSVISKLENIPLLDLGEANADLISLPAVLMANRHPESMKRESSKGDVEKAEEGERGDEGQKGEDPLPDPREIVDVKSSDPAPQDIDQNSQLIIWSGAAPSQRRKDVVIDPSYIGLQLLSSYPNASLDTPRGRLIPNEDKYLRALRGIENTPVIDTLKIAVLYVGPGQVSETEILGNIDGSPLYLDFLSGLGRLIRLKGQVDVFVGGLNRDNDSDGEYAYAWWDDLTQMIFHIPTMMPNSPSYPNYENKKRLVGNDYVKIVYNDSGKEFAFDTIKTAWNFINVIISPFNTGAGDDELPEGAGATNARWRLPGLSKSGQIQNDEGYIDWDREDWFKVTIQRVPGIPDFSPVGTHKLVSRKALPIFVRQIAHLGNDLAARFMHIKDATDAASAEYITSWRSRLRALHRLQASLPPVELPDENDIQSREQLRRDFTRLFTYRPAPPKEE